MTTVGSDEHKAAQDAMNRHYARVIAGQAPSPTGIEYHTPSHDFDHDDETDDDRPGLSPETIAVLCIWAATIVAAFVVGAGCGAVWG